MRIRINKTDIIEAAEIIVTPGGTGKLDCAFEDMVCSLTILIADSTGSEYSNKLEGEFNCTGASTLEECEAVAMKFVDELYENGKIDISTEEKRAKYGLTLF